MCIINNLFQNPCAECCGRALDGSCRYNCIAYKDYLQNNINKQDIDNLEKQLNINKSTYITTNTIKS